MKKLLLIIALLIPITGFSQKFLKNPITNNFILTIIPPVFDPEMDSTISFVEFWQDTTSGATYEEKVFAIIYEREKLKFPDGDIDWPIAAIGSIGDYRIGNIVSVIIQTHHKDGSVKTFTYQEKIKDIYLRTDFVWAMYSIDVEIIYNQEETEGL